MQYEYVVICEWNKFHWSHDTLDKASMDIKSEA